LLADWYGKVFACVKLGQSLSKHVQLSTGVRQGGVLSLYFLQYMSMILLPMLSVLLMVVKLQANMLGVIMHADDLILISAS